MSYLYNILNGKVNLKMDFKKVQRVPESAIYLIIWLMLFIIPVLATTSSTGRLDKQIIVGWLRMMPFLIIFVLNTVWLLPNLLFKGRTATYLLTVVVLSFFIVYVWQLIFPLIQDALQVDRIAERPLHDRQRIMPPEHRLPGQHPPGIRQVLPRQGVQNLAPQIRVLGIFNQMVIAWLVVGFNTALKITNKWFKDEQKKRELEKEHLKSELAFLQNQISPHFFMNTLNNIHAQIDIDSKEAQSSIVTLSKMMRYLLYESDRGLTTLKKEIEFLQSYVDLMKLRVDEGVDIDLNINVINEDFKIHPFLFISFIENAFKHGVSYNEKSFIKMEINQTKEELVFDCTNSISIKNKITSPYSGVGLENIKKRLNLLYDQNYVLDIKEIDSEYNVHLKLQNHEN